MAGIAQQSGVTGVPFVLLDGKWAISGSQTEDVYYPVRPFPIWHSFDLHLPNSYLANLYPYLQLFQKLVDGEDLQ